MLNIRWDLRGKYHLAIYLFLADTVHRVSMVIFSYFAILLLLLRILRFFDFNYTIIRHDSRGRSP